MFRTHNILIKTWKYAFHIGVCSYKRYYLPVEGRCVARPINASISKIIADRGETDKICCVKVPSAIISRLVEAPRILVTLHLVRS